MEQKLQERLASHVEREQLVMLRIHEELRRLAVSASGVEPLKERLLALASEAVIQNARPRGFII
jgi:hypothetical protein